MRGKNAVILFGLIYLLVVAMTLKTAAAEAVSGENLTAMCLESSLPCMDLVSAQSAAASKEPQAETASAPKAAEPKRRSKPVKKENGEPRVLIYHTHATESYLPSSAGNYHTTKEENTVRQAGDVLQDVLEESGIGVVHDKTLHDNPSYDQSYSRSFETLKSLLDQYPSIECIIDLHRDATAAKVAGPTETVEGKTCAAYSYVVSNTTETYEENKAFLHTLNRIAATEFDGYTGKILERPYWYNQELSGKSVLMEMGNNRNNIREVLQCAEIYGKILSKALN